MKSARTKACDISPSVRRIVEERDGGLSVISGKPGLPNAHFIPRSAGGMGIPQNIVTLTPEEHDAYDNGTKRKAYGVAIRSYLNQYYPGFPDHERIYRKYDF